MLETQVLIVGGGSAGGSLACALANRGISSILIEKRKVPTDLNRGDGIQPHSLEIMDRWGLLPAIRQAGALTSYGIEVHNPILGRVLEIDLGVVKTAHPYLLNLPHQQIETLLLEHATKSAYCQVLYGTIQNVLFENEQAIGAQALIDGEELEIRASVIAGADGASSLVRKSAGIVAPISAYDHALLVLHAKRPALFNEQHFRTKAYMHRKGGVVLIPLPENRMRIALLVKSTEMGKWKSLSEPDLRKQLTERFPFFADVDQLERHGEHLYHMKKMHAESYARNNCVLLGDAAHLTHAAGGQGMNMAIQDAEQLAKELEHALAGKVTLEQAYTAYEQTRRPINQKVLDRSEFMSKQLWTPTQRDYLQRTGLVALPRYVFPFINKRISTSIAWGNSGLQMQK